MRSRFQDGLVLPALRALAWLAVWALAAAAFCSPMALFWGRLEWYWLVGWGLASAALAWPVAAEATGRQVVDFFKTRDGSRLLGETRYGRYRE